MSRGGRRPFTSRRAGSAPVTRHKGMSRDRARQRLIAAIDAQIADAIGVSFFIVRDKKTGRFLRVAEAWARVKRGEEIIQVWEKDPSVQAIAALLDCALGKPTEQPQEVNVSGGLNVVVLLRQVRMRVAAAREKKRGR